jgi:hypothetical protein
MGKQIFPANWSSGGILRGGSAALLLVGLLGLAGPGCGGGETGQLTLQNSESCMLCHNASFEDDYAGQGIENPHPFPGADNLKCTACHGGNPAETDPLLAHVPPPPEIGSENFQIQNAKAYFNRLTLAGVDKFADYTVNGQTYSAIDFLQFVNPGDLRVTSAGRGCGTCHAPHSDSVAHSLLGGSAGLFSGATFASGSENQVPVNQGLYGDTAADVAFRAQTDPDWNPSQDPLGSVGEVLEFGVHSKHGVNAPDNSFNNPEFDTPALYDDIQANGQVVSGSPLDLLFKEQVAFTCGDCHLGSAGANNRAGDFRSSGCSACHMPYSLGGRSGSSDPNIKQNEPLDPDDIDQPERAHVRSHQIRSVKRTLSNGHLVEGIDDHTCAGCHQGSNRTVMQYWGIRLDQNQDVHRGRQYPSNPVSYLTTQNDTRLFDPAVGNNTFNGRNHRQYLLREDYDGDGRDDTPEDVHYAAGMGCIDCHGTVDLHGGDVAAGEDRLLSRQEQGIAIRCIDCHGTAESYAPTVPGTNYAGQPVQVATDVEGHALKHVTKTGADLFLTSRVSGVTLYVPQVRDLVVDTGKQHPSTQEPMYSPAASFAMGRADDTLANGIGPQQKNLPVTHGFSHSDNMNCAACHSSWTNTCMGCHLEGEYNTGNNFSNITGERIVFRQKFADFVYQSPLFFNLGVTARGEIGTFSANTKVFFRYNDRHGERSDVFTFSDREGKGSDPATPSGYGSMSHNGFMAHSIRGRVTPQNEGARQCVACHLTDTGIAQFGSEYQAFRDALQNRDYQNLDFNLLQQHFGRNTNNKLNSPLWVHMVAGLGSGVFLFDDQGRAMNPLDNDNQRKGMDGVSPASVFDPLKVALDLDRIVEPNGQPNGSNNHWMLNGPSPLRAGAPDSAYAGPLGPALIQKLTDPVNGLVLDAYIDSEGVPESDAAEILGNP